MRCAVIGLIGVLFLVGCSCEGEHESVAEKEPSTGAWLGQDPPGSVPTLFLGTALADRDTAWSPDGRQLFYSTWERRHGYILTRTEGPNGWSDARFADFSSPEYPELEPFVTSDGAWLYFISKRPMPNGTEPAKFNLWRVPAAGEDWGSPEILPEPLNTEHDEFYPSLTEAGDLYFTSDRPGGLGGEDIWWAEFTGDGWAEPENLGPAVNSPGPEFNSLIAPDGSWLIFGSAREGDFGGGDLFISFRGAEGEFLPAVNMGEPFNSAGLDYCPALSPDGSIFFFTSTRVPDGYPEPTTLEDLEALMSGPANGRDNIWWVDASLIEETRNPR
jgi:Tol biopolymer transport system component